MIPHLAYLFPKVCHMLTCPASAIHEIFASNAKKFPEKECVIETKGRGTPERTFTYRQIHESSNQLARYLLDNGCQVGHVVAIYAYRGSVSFP